MPIPAFPLDVNTHGSSAAALAHRQTPEGQLQYANFISDYFESRKKLKDDKPKQHQPQSQPSQRRSSPSGAVVVSEPDPQEITSVISTLNAERATHELDHYIKEHRLIEQRIRELSTEIKTIRLQLEKLVIPLRDSHRRVYSSNKTQKQIKIQKQKHRFDLHASYYTLDLEKQEEIMNLRDNLQEINENMENILRKYEDTRTLAEVLKKTGGKKRRTMKKSNSKRLNKHFNKSRRHTQT